MLINKESVKRYGGENLNERKHIEGERLERSKFVIQCGKNEEKCRPGVVNFTAFCLSISHFKEKPHEVHGEFTDNGEVLFCECSCAAGKGGKCKHVMSVLKYLEKREEDLVALSCTDKKCAWKKSFDNAMQNFVPAPLMLHDCYVNKTKKRYSGNNAAKENVDGNTWDQKKKKEDSVKVLSNTELLLLRTSACEKLPQCSVAKDMTLRHSMKTVTMISKVTDYERTVFATIFEFQESELMRKIQSIVIDLPKECCNRTLQALEGDAIEICVNTKNFYDAWQKERRLRITGSTCYGIFTYTMNKKADWEKKSRDTFTPKDFKSEFTEYGKKFEKAARKTYITVTNKNVVETGLIISQQNPWLGYSPDGVILKDNKVVGLLEVKCPVVGKTEGIKQTVQKQIKTFFSLDENENIKLRNKHKYYGQVQLGMAVLNVEVADFVIYSSHDKKVFILPVTRDELFIFNMLCALKKVYYSKMLHFLCFKENNNID